MINWSVDEKKFKRKNPTEYKIWRLTQLINYGLDEKKLDIREVKQFWGKIKNKIGEPAKQYLQYLLWGKLPSSTRTNKNF